MAASSRGGGVSVAKLSHKQLLPSAAWEATLAVTKALQSGDAAAAESAAAEAAAAARIERGLRAHGSTLTWQPSDFRASVRAHLHRRSEAAAAATAARPPKPTLAPSRDSYASEPEGPKYRDPENASELRLEQVS